MWSNRALTANGNTNARYLSVGIDQFSVEPDQVNGLKSKNSGILFGR